MCSDLSDDHWLGLEKLHILTKEMTKSWTLRIDLWDHEDGYAFAEYSDFRIGDERTAYRLHVGTYTGNAGNFSNHIVFYLVRYHK